MFLYTHFCIEAIIFIFSRFPSCCKRREVSRSHGLYGTKGRRTDVQKGGRHGDRQYVARWMVDRQVS